MPILFSSFAKKPTKCFFNSFKIQSSFFPSFLIIFYCLKPVTSLTMLHQQQQQQQQKPKFRLQLEDVGNPQPCPDNPIRLLASRTPQYIYSPYDENKLYPPDTDCQFLIEATDKFHRIHLTIIESDLEEALFTDCNDYVSVRDREGNETSIKEVARWCGQGSNSDYPAAIASASDSLLVHFHSDSIIQKRGFNISFVQFDIDTCPPDWISDGISSPYCYKQFVLPHILPWYEAQKECNFERANLATFQNEADYAFIVESYSQTHSFPWVGYSDANVEGIYESIDRNVPLWPENFPLKHENEMKDCVYLDWNKRDQIVVYEIDDCRNRRPFLCKKRRDGTEVPVVLPAGMIRRGFRDFTMDYTLLVVVVIFALLALVVGCVLFHKYKERNNRIINIDMNQRLVQQQQGQQPGNKDKAAAALARQKAKERERRELREQKYAETSNNNSNRGGRGGGIATTKSPFESQDSNASFPLQTFQSTFAQRMTTTTTENVEPLDTAAALAEATATASQQMREHEATKLHPQQLSAEIASVDSPPEDDLNSSPRIRMSPNQPSFVEEGRKISEKKIRKGWMGAGVSGGGTTDREEEEEEKDRHNMGYEPDSEEEEHEEKERQKIRRASKINGEGEGGEENNFLMEMNDEGGRKNNGENTGENNGENEELEQYTQHNHMDEELEQYSGGEEFKQYKHKNVVESEQYVNSQQFKQLESDGGEIQQKVVQVELHGENGEEGGLSQFKDKRTKEERITNFDEKMMDSYAIGDHFKAAKVATSAIASAAIAATEHPIRPPIELMRTTRTTSTDKTKTPPPKEAKESEKIGESGKSSREATREGKEEKREEKETFPEKVSGKGNIPSTANIVKTEGEGTGTRIRIKRKTFDRPPPVGPLDNVSAISLDEFWQQQ